MFSLNVSSDMRFEIFKDFIKRHAKKCGIFIIVIILCAKSFGVGSQSPTAQSQALTAQPQTLTPESQTLTAQASLLNSEINDDSVESIIDYLTECYNEKGITFIDNHKFIRNSLIRGKALNILKLHIDALVERDDKKKLQISG